MVELRFGDRGLEQLDGVARGIVDDDLASPDAIDQAAARMGTSRDEPAVELFDVVNFDREPVPSAGGRQGPVGKRGTAAWPAAGLAQREAQVTSCEHRERSAPGA